MLLALLLLLLPRPAAAGQKLFLVAGEVQLRETAEGAAECGQFVARFGGQRATAHLVCGKIGAGKSTFASLLRRCLDLEVLSADAFLRRLVPRMRVEQFQEYGPQVKQLIIQLAQRFLRRGVSVAVDFSFWFREERDSVRRQLGFERTRLWHVDPGCDNTRKQRAQRRNAALPDDCFEVDERYLEDSARLFEDPAPEEGAVRVQS